MLKLQEFAFSKNHHADNIGCDCWDGEIWSMQLAWPTGRPVCRNVQHAKLMTELTMSGMLLLIRRYIIPEAVVRHFLREFELSGRFRGVCSLGFRWQDLESQGLRAFLQVPSRPWGPRSRPAAAGVHGQAGGDACGGGVQVPGDRSGCVIHELDPLAPAACVLQQKDVVLEIEGARIADDGTIQVCCQTAATATAPAATDGFCAAPAAATSKSCLCRNWLPQAPDRLFAALLQFRHEERVELVHAVRGKHLGACPRAARTPATCLHPTTPVLCLASVAIGC